MFDFEFGKIFEDPTVLERIVDNGQQLACGGDDRFPRAATFLDALIEGVQVASTAISSSASRLMQNAWRALADNVKVSKASEPSS